MSLVNFNNELATYVLSALSLSYLLSVNPFQCHKIISIRWEFFSYRYLINHVVTNSILAVVH